MVYSNVAPALKTDEHTIYFFIFFYFVNKYICFLQFPKILFYSLNIKYCTQFYLTLIYVFYVVGNASNNG